MDKSLSGNVLKSTQPIKENFGSNFATISPEKDNLKLQEAFLKKPFKKLIMSRILESFSMLIQLSKRK